MSALLVEQDVGVALGHADRGYVLETGRIVLADAAQALLGNTAMWKAYLGIGEETGHPGGSVLLTAADAPPCDHFRSHGRITRYVPGWHGMRARDSSKPRGWRGSIGVNLGGGRRPW